jgi:CheY-like chemotaxis protein
MHCRIIRARNGKEAIELFQAGKDEIDLIFMDILMPECDGFEATREIHKIRKDIPVVAQTAFTFEGELSDGLYAGCFNDYILKPFNIKTIRDIMEKYLFTG